VRAVDIAAAAAALRLSCSLSLSRSAPLAFYYLDRCSTLRYTLPTHAREHQPVWSALLHTGLDWIAPQQHFVGLAAPSCRMSAEVEAASRALETEQEFWDELDTIVTPEHDSYEHIDDVLRAFIDFAARHKCTSYFHFKS